jgi:hypothetical protein
LSIECKKHPPLKTFREEALSFHHPHSVETLFTT